MFKKLEFQKGFEPIQRFTVFQEKFRRNKLFTNGGGTKEPSPLFQDSNLTSFHIQPLISLTKNEPNLELQDSNPTKYTIFTSVLVQ